LHKLCIHIKTFTKGCEYILETHILSVDYVKVFDTTCYCNL
jgi:hypothetical protein